MASKSGHMANIDITVGGTAVTVMKLRNWSYTATVEEIDTTAAGQEWTTVEAGHKSWEGDAEVVDVDTFYLDHLGEKATIKFYMAEGDTTYEEGVALLTEIEKNTPYDDLIDQTISFKGDGALTKKTTP
jgi:hypothetical protein